MADSKCEGRPRACGALLKDDFILMVRIVSETKEFWTLPGGGLETGESFEEAVVREVKEEVNLDVRVKKFLFTTEYEGGIEKCFLIEDVKTISTPLLGIDPELPIEQQELKEVKWQPIKELRNDIQISKVIDALRLTFD